MPFVLVSFGGIAGLFLGFSLLSGVEIIYYFTMRACCMVIKEKVNALELLFLNNEIQCKFKKVRKLKNVCYCERCHATWLLWLVTSDILRLSYILRVNPINIIIP